MAVSDLTGTKWEINSTTCTAGYGEFDITGTYGDPVESGIDFIKIGYVMIFPGQKSLRGGGRPEPNPFYASTDDNILINGNPTYLFVGDIIEITGGTDATNPDLIAWLEANATQIVEPSEPLTSSFNETLVVDNSAYLSLYINGVEFKLEKGSASVSLISFYVNPPTMGEVAGYQAESGMTWAEWVASAYNTSGFFVSYNAIYVGPYVVKSDFNGPLVVPTDEIISNKTYYLVSGGNVD